MRLASPRSLPDASAIAALHDGDYFGAVSSGGYVDYVGDENVHRRNVRRHLGRLGGLHPPGTLLEVGSAAGFLLDEARHAGWEVRGIEVSEPMTREAEERFGLQLVDDVSRIDLPRASVDVVLANQVIEHLVNRLETLAAARELLRPVGMLVVETWDQGSLGESDEVEMAASWVKATWPNTPWDAWLSPTRLATWSP